MFVAGIDAHATYSVIALVSKTGQLVAGPIRNDVTWPLLGDERRLFIDMQWALVDQHCQLRRGVDPPTLIRPDSPNTVIALREAASRS